MARLEAFGKPFFAPVWRLVASVCPGLVGGLALFGIGLNWSVSRLAGFSHSS